MVHTRCDRPLSICRFFYSFSLSLLLLLALLGSHTIHGLLFLLLDVQLWTIFFFVSPEPKESFIFEFWLFCCCYRFAVFFSPFFSFDYILPQGTHQISFFCHVFFGFYSRINIIIFGLQRTYIYVKMIMMNLKKTKIEIGCECVEKYK